jgi:hypothetical protein
MACRETRHPPGQVQAWCLCLVGALTFNAIILLGVVTAPALTWLRVQEIAPHGHVLFRDFEVLKKVLQDPLDFELWLQRAAAGQVLDEKGGVLSGSKHVV